MKNIIVVIFVCFFVEWNCYAGWSYIPNFNEEYSYSDRHADYIESVSNNEFFNVAFFCNDSVALTRGEMSVLAMRIFQKLQLVWGVISFEESIFHDADECWDSGMNIYFEQAYGNNLVFGETFTDEFVPYRMMYPNRKATKEEIYTSFARVVKYFSAAFPEDYNKRLDNDNTIENESISDWSYKYINYLTNCGIISEPENINFQDNVTYDEAMELAERIYGFIHDDMNMQKFLQDNQCMYWYEYAYRNRYYGFEGW